MNAPPDLVLNFRGNFYFLSNFYPCRMLFDGRILPSAEHAYQLSKTLDPAQRDRIATAETAGMAKRFGRQLTRAQLRPDWDSENHKVMREVIRAKFAENDDLASALLQTGTAILIEGNNWGDTYWGMMETSPCVWIGENHLGKILMAERDRLRSKDLTPRRLT